MKYTKKYNPQKMKKSKKHVKNKKIQEKRIIRKAKDMENVD